MSSASAAPAPSTTSFAPTISPSAPPAGGGGGGGGGSSQNPLLFFVALGFGVVFTNLWIIVGVKYCFRYNARQRARQQAENAEAIDLAHMPHRRRRREKKLMTVDEVNERFPVTKYKSWVASRAAQGLSTEGGVSQSRAASVRDAEGVIEPLGESSKSIMTADVASTNEVVPTTPTTSNGPKTANSPTSRRSEDKQATITETALPAETAKGPETETGAIDSSFAGNVLPPPMKRVATQNSADEDEGPAPAVPGAAEMLEAPGDSCAICIDVLESEDDIRGLTCGHAFHASCIDPWLTNRRACCPLCKADYYTPKPRPELPEGLGPQPARSTTFDDLTVPPRALSNTMPAGSMSRYMPRLTSRSDALVPERRSPGIQVRPMPASDTQTPPSNLSSRLASLFHRQQPESNSPGSEPTPSPAPPSNMTTTATTAATTADDRQSSSRRWMPSLPSWRRNRPAEESTPGQLEAGTPVGVAS